MEAQRVFIYDTTLRDGTHGEKINFSAEEKLRIAQRLDELGFHYIEGGWPGSNPKDVRFFEMAKGFSFRHARLTAFGSTRKPGIRPENCRNLRALLRAETPAVAIFGKSWNLHVTEILGIPLEENLEMIRDSIAFLKARGKEVIFDAEHFFDGWRHNPAYSLETLKAARDAEADWIVLCDTNGGALPHDLTAAVQKVAALFPLDRLGIHVHNDCGLAVANTLAAVHAGAVMVQGTVNGYGERCGNADLTSVIGNLQLKMNRACLSEASLRQLTNLSYYVSEVANVRPLPFRPFVGRSAFAHKGGVHVSALAKNPLAYEHIRPEWVGNRQRVLVSDLAGKSSIAFKAKELGIDLGDNEAVNRKIVWEIKRLEDQGFQFDAADGSLALLMKKITGAFKEPFTLQCFSVTNGKTRNNPSLCQATIKISVGNEEELTAAEGNGPVNALDHALRKALTKFYPQINEMHLIDFKVRIVEGSEGTAARVKVLLDSRDGEEVWSTIGVSENIIEASWQALVDSIQYKLSKDKLNKNDHA
ncbi:MAG: citramalate synthase [Deltaproteobacteria bacterium RBG_16_58_17]|nr:MAG: citramalate synthase [Deltaproteobacteria bacterium RBG_16_58_17]OHE18661.1 MAG: citramalate synthase [Syntrophobacterales bacterium GWC2_56_13]